jgi:hypothetical protein
MLPVFFYRFADKIVFTHGENDWSPTKKRQVTGETQRPLHANARTGREMVGNEQDAPGPTCGHKLGTLCRCCVAHLSGLCCFGHSDSAKYDHSTAVPSRHARYHGLSISESPNVTNHRSGDNTTLLTCADRSPVATSRKRVGALGKNPKDVTAFWS